jgi:type I restriction enzyme, S subunit
MRSWARLPLGEIAPAQSLPLPPPDAVVWNLSLEDVESVTGRVLAKHSSRVADLGSSKCVFDQRHVLYSKLRPYLNKVVVPDASGVGTSELIPLAPDGRLDREFLAWYLRSPGFVEFANANTRGANLPRIAMAELWAHQIPVPPTLAEQRRIVSRIKACMERVEEIETLRVGAEQEAAAITPSLLNEVFVYAASRAPSKPIDELALETRYGTSQKCHVEPTGVPILRIPNVAAGSVNFDPLKYCELSDEELRRIQLLPGDLLFVRTNGSRDLVGRCAVFEPRIAEEPVGFASYLIRVRLDPKQVLPRYLAYFLNSTQGREEINQRRRTSAGQFNINSENLRSISLPVPSVQEQARLIAMMEERDLLASQLTGELRTAAPERAQMRESILRKAFAGKL